MRRGVAVLGAAALVAGLVACGSDIRSGTVVAHRHAAAYCQDVLLPVVVGTNSTVWVPDTQCYPETWSLRLRNGERTGWVDVDAGTYARVRDGERYASGR